MFGTYTASEPREHHYEGGEDTALFVAIKRTILKEVDHLVADDQAETVWYVRANVDSPFSPVVTLRSNA